MGEGGREEGRRCPMERKRRRKGVGSRKGVGGRRGRDAARVGEIERDVKAVCDVEMTIQDLGIITSISSCSNTLCSGSEE